MTGRISTPPPVDGVILRYEKETGDFYWLSHPRCPYKNGRRADVKGTHGYKIVCFDRKQYLAHRVAWFLVTGEWPQVVDHKNGERGDNRWDNLRKADYATNGQNLRQARSDSRSGYLGVYRSKSVKMPWSARITVSGKAKYLGSFPTAPLAYEAYVQAKRKVHVGCTI